MPGSGSDRAAGLHPAPGRIAPPGWLTACSSPWAGDEPQTTVLIVDTSSRCGWTCTTLSSPTVFATVLCAKPRRGPGGFRHRGVRSCPVLRRAAADADGLRPAHRAARYAVPQGLVTVPCCPPRTRWPTGWPGCAPAPTIRGQAYERLPTWSRIRISSYAHPTPTRRPA